MSTREAKDRTYTVGYGKPPKSTQFKKGQSGNPKGRPKGAQGVKASLKRELEKPVTVREGNREIKISKAEAIAKRLIAQAMNGSEKAIAQLLGLDTELADQPTAAGMESDPGTNVDPVDLELLRDYLLEQPRSDGRIEGEEVDNDGT